MTSVFCYFAIKSIPHSCCFESHPILISTELSIYVYPIYRRAKKILPKFIGPFKIVEAHTAASMVTLDLPPELTAWRVHPMFHVSLIQAHIPNDDGRFPR